jgi:hypothetical protein
MKYSLVAITLAGVSPLAVVGFTAPTRTAALKADTTAIQAEAGDSRRDFMSKSLATVATSVTAGMGVLAPLPANAVKGADKVNAQLKA